MINSNDFAPTNILDINFFDTMQNNEKIHIRIRQRNTRKYITIIENIPETHDFVKILKAMKNKFNCNGSLHTNQEDKKYIQLFGDQRDGVKKYIIDQKIANSENIIVHGF